ncbi:MAG: CDF family Co(II)/Ni(II) efflux transporter DmeF [Armatimonadota bacterium]
MHHSHLSRWQHHHHFNPAKHAAERRTILVVALTFATMVAEIVAGMVYGSMALLADGWHMSTHTSALAISWLAYVLARRYRHDQRFAFGTWKIEVLGAYTSAILLGIIGAGIAGASVQRMLQPTPIAYNQALLVAVIGLVVNLLSARILHHEHPHEASHEHHHDLNLRAAYLHVLADALTSGFAIVALLGAKHLGWNWLDPVAGALGAFMILRWTYGLLKDSVGVLLDRDGSSLPHQIVQAIESDGDTRISDLHVWRVGQNSYACILSVVAENPDSPDGYRQRLAHLPQLAHVTVEIHQCRSAAALTQG